ncbi:chemotaxis protein, partial [Flagellimonas sp.]|uniref:chemotaxis protein n=1 Tax=Flagellimonas sp. TaxID=2058762 RepID=UPI003AB55F5F
MSSQAKQSQKLLLFRLFGSRLFGIGTLKIREILPFPRLTKLPHSHHAVIGTATFRGSAVPVIDMSAAVGFPALTKEEQETASIIVTDIQRQEIGFLVRGVQQIIETDWKSVMPPPKALGTNVFIIGLLDVGGDIIQLLDLELLLAKVYPESLNTQEVTLSDVQGETLSSLNILLVDDSQVARKQLSDVLDSKGIHYHVTSNGSEALKILLKEHDSGHPIDILVSDIE